jgi:hypothetical protein
LVQFEIGVQLTTDTDIWFGSKASLLVLIVPVSKCDNRRFERIVLHKFRAVKDEAAECTAKTLRN